jgi:vacuolar-type H+-ATPase subunit I/STV1
LWYNIYRKKEKEINKMTVTLMVNWKEKEILTTKQLDEKINERVKDIMSNEDSYREELDNYLDNNYSKLELFNALASDEATMTEVIDDVRSGVAETIYDWCNTDVRWEYEEVTIEV